VSTTTSPAIGASLDRVEAHEKVTGEARYAYEYPQDGVAYAVLVRATVATGVVRTIGADAARARAGVLAVLSHENAPALHEVEGELAVLQSPRVAYRGQIVAAVIGESLEAAQEGAALLEVAYDAQPPDVVLRPDHPSLYQPETVNPDFPSDSEDGDFAGAFARAQISLDEVYETPAFHNNPMEPHATMAVWGADGGLTLYDSTQGTAPARQTIAKAFGLDETQVRVISPHVGGGFGSKGTPRPHVIVSAMAARLAGRPVKLAVTRQQMFTLTGYRTPTIQRIRLGADRNGQLIAIGHDVVEQTSKVAEFAEQTAVVTRMLYASPNRRTTHRLAELDVPTPSWMRAPGECPGMFALESAIDELAIACELDPIELRIRNEPTLDPETGNPFSSRHLVECLRAGAERFGWHDRDPRPGMRREGAWLIGNGVAVSTYPARRRPCKALVRREDDGAYTVRISAADIGTGSRTALTQIAAEALEVDVQLVRVELGDSAFPAAPVAGGSMGTASFGSAVFKACKGLLASPGLDEFVADTAADVEADDDHARHGYGAQFVEARVNTITGEIRVPRALGVFAVGTIINPKTARSQLIGGMTMGLSMALLEESVIDEEFGDYLTRDLATYHVATYADIGEIDATWVAEDDPHLNPMGSKGIGEIGIVGTAAAVANAVRHATGHRFRRLPIRVDRVLEALPQGSRATRA
jgi:xanthine dehydrogenase YagR molybdenum-binding subunit